MIKYNAAMIPAFTAVPRADCPPVVTSLPLMSQPRNRLLRDIPMLTH